MIQKITPFFYRYFWYGISFLYLVGCFLWNFFYELSGKKEWIKFLLLLRMLRIGKIYRLFQKLKKKSIDTNYIIIRIVELLVSLLYSIYVIACLLYYIASLMPRSSIKKKKSWIGKKKSWIGKRKFRVNIFSDFVNSVYFSAVTIMTIGYGDFSPKDLTEKIVIIIISVFGNLLVSYMIGSISYLNVKRLMDEKFMSEMYHLTKFMKMNNVRKDTRKQIKKHFQLQNENAYIEEAAIQNIPESCRNQVLECLFKECIEKVSLFKDCTAGFIEEIVHKLHVEYFHPEEIVLKERSAVYRLYFVYHGRLEGNKDFEGGEVRPERYGPNDSFGALLIQRNMLMPWSVKACELSKLISLDRKSFKKILKRYYVDSQAFSKNLLEVNKKPFDAHQNFDHPNVENQPALGWNLENEIEEDFFATLDAISTQVDIGIVYCDVYPRSRYLLLSLVCTQR